MARAFGIINSSSNHIYVEGMQDYRPIGAFSFLGRYRAVDFPISNMSNSNIEHVQVFLNQNPRSLVEHLGSGRHYNINSKRGKVQLLFSADSSATSIYNTDIASFFKNLESIRKANASHVVIAPSYIVYVEDYQKLLDKHIASGADVTLLYHKVDNADKEYLNSDELIINRQQGVERINKNRGIEPNKNIFLDTYVMTKELFINLVEKAHNLSSMYTLCQIVNMSCGDLDVRGVEHTGFFAPLTTFKNFYKYNMSLIDYSIARELFDAKWPIYTRTNDSCPTQYYAGSSVKGSVVSNGCLVEGTVENSIIGRGCVIGKGCVIKNCIISSDVVIAEGTYLENLVVDKHAKITHAKEIVCDAENPGYVKRGDTL